MPLTRLKVRSFLPLTSDDTFVRDTIQERFQFRGHSSDPAIATQIASYLAWADDQNDPAFFFDGWFIKSLTRRDDDGYGSNPPLPDPVQTYRDLLYQNTSFESDRLGQIKDGIIQAGYSPSEFVFNFEDQLGPFNPFLTQAVLDDNAAWALFPQALKDALPARTLVGVPDPTWRAYVISCAKHSNTINKNSLRKIMKDSGLAALGKPIAVTFSDPAPTFPIYDEQGWPYANGTTSEPDASADGYSSYLEPYLSTGNFRYPAPTLYKHVGWNALIESINKIVALSTASVNGKGCCIPLVATSIDDGRHWTPLRRASIKALVEHSIMAGVRCFDLYNELQLNGVEYDAALLFREADAFAANAPRLDVPPFPPVPLQEVPLDADEIVTNGHVTTYEQWILSQKE